MQDPIRSTCSRASFAILVAAAVLLTLATAPAFAITPPGTHGVAKDRGFTITPPWTPGRSFNIICVYGCGLHQNGSGGSQDYFALDFGMNRGETIYPVAPGKVIFAKTATGGWSGYGNLVIVEHQNDYESIYAHLDSIAVGVGQQVDVSTPLGGAGNSGTSAVHLHFAMYKGSALGSGGPYGGSAVVPEPFSSCTRSGGDCENIGYHTLRRDDWAPEAVANPDGGVELFTCGRTSRHLLHRRRAADGTWQGWFDLQGVCASSPSAAVDASGRLYVFVRGLDNTLWYRMRSGGSWGGWTSLGNSIVGRPAVALDTASGRLRIFVRDVSGALEYAYQSGTTFISWFGLGGVLVDSPAAGRRGDGRVDAFVRGLDYTLWKNPASTSGTYTANNFLSQSIRIEGVPDLNLHANGWLEIFARTTGDQLWHRAPNPGGWLNANQSLGEATHPPAVEANADGRLQVFVRDRSTSAVDYVYQLATGGWSGWRTFGGLATSELEAVRPTSGRILFFTWGTDNLYYREQSWANGTTSWGNWQALDVPN